MARNILVVAEVRNGQLRPVSFECIAAGRAIAEGGSVTAVLLSQADVDGSELIARGADRVVLVKGEHLKEYTPDGWLSALQQVYLAEKADVVLMGHTGIGRDLLPRFAMRNAAGMISDAIAVKLEGGQVVFTRPIYAGKAYVTQIVTEGLIVATIRPNNVAALEADAGRSGDVVQSEAAPVDLRTVVKEVVRQAATGVDLTAAKIVVAGGRGVKSAEGFKPLYELAEVLGAAVGASRAAADAGFCDYALQIGQTGKTVTPDLYIACGISGAIQHLAGMSASKVIVAINKDPEAPIFKVADYGIVGDLFEVVPLLTREFKALLG
ncbi:electron transfer flavoprotein alpha subunit [Symbiobacterium terraclitae]|uniref:Electron transfer flavoprotein alpha subunit n=1 Tax=Symbiobacterium terraclitae TaxID=557451 RepID=A0ABS4JN68_9FIRM|nr:electron transfer flavoprotein subunit alpha/FixB family protein [Symbiobacterium terraclitae]MBP2016983.1 electron transfer flavoprotein alpha subunit [Symbiobacterium terraclitae]